MSDELVKAHTHKAAKAVPDHIWKLTQHYHDLFELKKHWEANGVTCPKHFNQELQRAHDLLEELLEEEWGQGGVYHEAAKRKENETRTSVDSSSVSQNRTQEPGSQPGRSKPIGPRSGLA